MIRSWAGSSGLSGALLERLAFAASEIYEAVYSLARETHTPGTLRIEVKPYTRWLTVEMTFPKAIPLDPVFNPDDPLLADLPEMKILPDVFWRQVIIRWVDQARWHESGKRTTVALTQYARCPEHAGELFFLGLTPRPAPGLSLNRVENQFAVATVPGGRCAFRISASTAFVLRAVDGRTTVREIYAAYVKAFRLVHPAAVGRIVEELVCKGLIVTGEPLAGERRGWLSGIRCGLTRLLTFQYSLPRPDAAVEAVFRFAGFIWSRSMLWIGLAAGLSLFLLAPLGFPPPWRSGPDPSTVAISAANIALFYLGMNLSIILHEFAHAVTCKRLGGRIHAMGIMLYFFFFCAFVDTTDAWSFRKKSQRIMVSLSGPLTDLALASFFAWGGVLVSGWGQATLAAGLGTLSTYLLLSVAMNLNPFMETDGYYALMDILGETNLRKKAFRAVTGIWRKPDDESASRLKTIIRQLPYILFAAAWVLVPANLILLAIASPFGKSSLLKQIMAAIAILYVLQRLVTSATHWYRRTGCITRDLKVNEWIPAADSKQRRCGVPSPSSPPA